MKFKNAKPCGRCVMVNNNPKNGIVKKEPLNTFTTYLKVDNSILFGTNVICLNEDEISIGDAFVF